MRPNVKYDPLQRTTAPKHLRLIDPIRTQLFHLAGSGNRKSRNEKGAAVAASLCKRADGPRIPDRRICS